MRVIVTGTSEGIGRSIAMRFLGMGWDVIGIDRNKSTILPGTYDQGTYTHYDVDIVETHALPNLCDVDVIINNAGIQSTEMDGSNIEVNLKAAMRLTEKYLHPKLKSILFIGSVSAHSGFEFPEYVASKAGLVGYMKNVAMRVAKNGTTCNSLDPGGVLTELNLPVTSDPVLWKEIMDVTPLKRWALPEEIADWAYFLTVTQSFCTGQAIVVDGGEKDLNGHFVWPE